MFALESHVIGSPPMGKLNHLTLVVFAPVLVLTGITGFLGPAPWDLMSTAAPYNIMHICAGTVGIAFAASKRDSLVRGFNIGFGAFDLYQLVASLAGLWPTELFAWHRGDDVLHGVLGGALVVIGLSRR